MKRILLSTTFALIGLASPIALAQDAAVNANCPIGKEPIIASAGTIEHKGNTVGFCCPSCKKNFLAQSDERKDQFITLAIAGKESGNKSQMSTPTSAEQASSSGPYTLSTCPVSGKKLGSMGDPIVKAYDGREIRFCCSGCIGDFEADQAGYLKKLDAKIIEDQLPYYPDICVVSDESLTMDGEDIGVNTVIGNRLVRTCCKKCAGKVKEAPQVFIAKLDEVVADAQRGVYPLTTCVVADGKLGSMGDPTEMVVAGRLMRFCCASCEPKVEANPAKYIAAIDKAWEDKGGFKQESVPAKHGGHGGHGHDGHAH